MGAPLTQRARVLVRAYGTGPALLVVVVVRGGRVEDELDLGGRGEEAVVVFRLCDRRQLQRERAELWAGVVDVEQPVGGDMDGALLVVGGFLAAAGEGRLSVGVGGGEKLRRTCRRGRRRSG